MFNFNKYLESQGFKKERTMYAPRNAPQFFRKGSELLMVHSQKITYHNGIAPIPESQEVADSLIKEIREHENTSRNKREICD